MMHQTGLMLQKKVTFGSLATYDEQLSSQGFKPIPINLELKLTHKYI